MSRAAQQRPRRCGAQRPGTALRRRTYRAIKCRCLDVDTCAMKRLNLRRTFIAVAVTGAVAGVYVNGNFDASLAGGQVPLNLHECATTINGTTLCGAKLDAVRELQRQAAK